MSEIVLPTSLRKNASELFYQQEKAAGLTNPLQDQLTIVEYGLWRLVDNRYPWDMVAERHDMLIPKRAFCNRGEMTVDEFKEKEEIVDELLVDEFHLYMENSPSRRSVNSIYHLHMIKLYEDRGRFGA